MSGRNCTVSSKRRTKLRSFVEGSREDLEGVRWTSTTCHCSNELDGGRRPSHGAAANSSRPAAERAA
eukprot:2383232-Prymnesium_polylepis.1